ncbi:DUF1707 SHOCT-like domain-containing protein [Streptomyces sp. NPDC002851]
MTPERIGHAERDQAVDLLKNAYAEGRLDASEFEERVDSAMHARTRDDLDPLFEDLPAPPPARPDPATSPDRTDLPSGDAPQDRPHSRTAAWLRSAARTVMCCTGPSRRNGERSQDPKVAR